MTRAIGWRAGWRGGRAMTQDDRDALGRALSGDFVPSLLIAALVALNIVGWWVITP